MTTEKQNTQAAATPDEIAEEALQQVAGGVAVKLMARDEISEEKLLKVAGGAQVELVEAASVRKRFAE
jgi:hypothetical protein